MPSDCIFCNSYKQYSSFTKFTINCYGAPYKTCKSYKVNSLFYFFLITAFLTLYIGEEKGMVLTTFNGPSTAYKLNYSYRCFRYYFRYYFRCCFSFYFPSPYTARINPAATTSINLATTACINLAAIAYINLAATCCSPPYYRPVGY